MSETSVRQQMLEEADEEENNRETDRQVDYARIKRWMIKRDGKDYVQFAGLLDLLHQESNGDFTISTKLEQAPTANNGMLAIVSAVVILAGGRSASGLGDASAESVNRMMAPHLVRMAETRAKGRALRDLLNVPFVTTEELGPDGPVRDHDRDQPNDDDTGIVINNRRYSRAQVWSAYVQRMEQMKAAGLAVLPHQTLTNTAPLPQLVGMTQQMRRQLETAGAAGNGSTRSE